MIIFKELKFKNFLSYGNNYTTYTFQNGITKVQGINGSGKSTPFLDVLRFVLFGTPYRKVKKGQLVNCKNKKNLETYLTFRKQDDDYRIERGIKPDFFRIYKNDVIVPVASSVRGYQEILTEDILQYDENIDDQVNVKSMTKNTAFMTLTKGEKRKIVENLLDIEVFSIMGKNLKTKIDLTEAELKNLKKDIDNTELHIGQERENLEKLTNLKRKLESEINTNVNLYKTEITTLTESIANFNKGLVILERKKIEYKTVSEQISKVKEDIYNLTQDIAKYQATLDMHHKKIKFLERTCGDCPKIKALMDDNDASVADAKIDSSKVSLEQSNKELLILEEKSRKIRDMLSNERFLVESIAKNKKRITELEGIINKSKESIIEIDESKLKLYIKNKKAYEAHYNQVHKKKIHLVLLRSLCADDGIKINIIKKYLPTINKLLNTYLAKFQADIVFNFDHEFNEVILTKYKEDFTYESFSQGQKKRIDLAVMFAFIKFAQMKNKKSDTNILIMDEVLTSLDQQGTESVMEVLKEYKEKYNKCIVTVNHLTDLSPEFFDYSYNVKMEKGFSKIEEVQI